MVHVYYIDEHAPSTRHPQIIQTSPESSGQQSCKC
jgi:hypothetical protein